MKNHNYSQSFLNLLKEMENPNPEERISIYDLKIKLENLQQKRDSFSTFEINYEKCLILKNYNIDLIEYPRDFTKEQINRLANDSEKIELFLYLKNFCKNQKKILLDTYQNIELTFNFCRNMYLLIFRICFLMVNPENYEDLKDILDESLILKNISNFYYNIYSKINTLKYFLQDLQDKNEFGVFFVCGSDHAKYLLDLMKKDCEIIDHKYKEICGADSFSPEELLREKETAENCKKSNEIILIFIRQLLIKLDCIKNKDLFLILIYCITFYDPTKIENSINEPYIFNKYYEQFNDYSAEKFKILFLDQILEKEFIL